jgi:hypothetical protein
VIVNNLIQIKHLHEISGLLQAENIKFIPLKGLSLITDTYPDIGMRFSADLDILIHPADFDKCAEVLKKSSYRFEPSLTRGVRTNHGQECIAVSQDNLGIDIHYRFFAWYEEKYIFKIDIAKFYENTVNKLWKGYDLAYMKKEDEFYYLLMCIFNIFKNRLGAFRYYSDADAILKIHGTNFDWDLVKSYLWSSPLKQYWKSILKFMRDRLKTPIPDELVLPEDDVSEKAYLFSLDKRIMKPCTNKTKTQLFYLHATQKFEDKLALVLLFLKWQLFKRFGCFRSFFITHNNPRRNGT